MTARDLIAHIDGLEGDLYHVTREGQMLWRIFRLSFCDDRWALRVTMS